MKENWKNIDGYESYQISDLGRVRSKDRMVKLGDKDAYRRQAGKVLKPWAAKNTGYLQVDLNGVRKIVHRLVAIAFCSGYSEGLEVNHKNGIRSDNRAENLEWVTPSENQIHSFTQLARKTTAVPVISVDKKSGEEKVYSSMQEAADQGFTKSEICNCCKGKKKSHKGFFWKYAEAA